MLAQTQNLLCGTYLKKALIFPSDLDVGYVPPPATSCVSSSKQLRTLVSFPLADVLYHHSSDPADRPGVSQLLEEVRKARRQSRP